jgi:hypothetical protein
MSDSLPETKTKPPLNPKAQEILDTAMAAGKKAAEKNLNARMTAELEAIPAATTHTDLLETPRNSEDDTSEVPAVTAPESSSDPQETPSLPEDTEPINLVKISSELFDALDTLFADQTNTSMAQVRVKTMSDGEHYIHPLFGDKTEDQLIQEAKNAAQTNAIQRKLIKIP